MPIRMNYRLNKSISQVKAFLATSLFIVVILLVSPVLSKSIIQAGDYCDDIKNVDERAECVGKKIDKKTDQLDDAKNLQESIAAKIKEYLTNLSVTQDQINSLQVSINKVVAQLKIINENLSNRKESLEKKTDLRNLVLRTYYQSSNMNSLEIFLSSINDLSGFRYSSLVYMFDTALSEEALGIIDFLTNEITQFESDKAEAKELQSDLEINQQNLLSLKADIDYQKSLAESVHEDLSDQISDLKAEIANLSDKQRSILQAKYGSEIVSGYEAAEYKLPDPPFKPAFVAMSYGAYTHRNGMSQYGAKGRADDGDDYNEILEYYYETDAEKKDNFPSELKVDGYGEMNFQKYLYGIAEMPSDWPMDALKAQAIAARSYAYRFAKDGKTICITQSCQVFLKSKSDNPPDRWKKAVDDTKSKILDDPETTQYSSTTGGYLRQTGWDKDGGSWPGDAYERKAKSPWFYKAWYTQSYYDSSSTCGRDTPWLEEDEMADILNAWVVWRKGSSSEKDHISPVTTSCWGGDPYSISKMADKAGNYGEEYTDIDEVWVDISSSGYTSRVYFRTNKGTINIDGNEFLTVFNLRAPSYVSIRGTLSGTNALYDIEHEK